MLEPQSLAAYFYSSDIVDNDPSFDLEFNKLYTRDRHDSTLNGLLRH